MGVCNEMVDGLINVCIGQAFIGFFYFFVVIVGCMGMNRFHKDNYADNPAKVHPANQDIESGPPGGLQAQKQDTATPGQYSAIKSSKKEGCPEATAKTERCSYVSVSATSFVPDSLLKIRQLRTRWLSTHFMNIMNVIYMNCFKMKSL